MANLPTIRSEVFELGINKEGWINDEDARAHEVRSRESATNMIIHAYVGNTRIMHKKSISVRIIAADAGILSQAMQDLHNVEGE